jgi:hypothetical protein
MNGILLVDKPADWTSHDVVAKLRGVLGERRMGHSGTLDPMATGLLVVFAGRATRAVSFSENHSKCYEARLRLGLTTDTQDTTGTVLSRCDRRVTRAELESRSEIMYETYTKVISIEARTMLHFAGIFCRRRRCIRRSRSTGRSSMRSPGAAARSRAKRARSRSKN